MDIELYGHEIPPHLKEFFEPVNYESPFAPKDVVPTPWLIAIAAQYDGWYLRSPIIWSKSNAMPSSADDRPTLDYENVLLLAKSDQYYYDAHGIREPLNEKYAQRRLTDRSEHPKFAGMPPHRRPNYALRDEPAPEGNPAGRNKRATWDPITETARFALDLQEAGYELDDALQMLLEDEGVAYAARSIQAATPPAVCARCGKPYRRMVERVISEPLDDVPYQAGGQLRSANMSAGTNGTNGSSLAQPEKVDYVSLGWLPDCDCFDHTPVEQALELYHGGHDMVSALRHAHGFNPDELVADSEHLWRVKTVPYKGSHYATWPPALVARMVQGGTPPAVCARCGTPYERITERPIATNEAGDDPTLDIGRAGFSRPRQGEAQVRVLTVPQAEIAAYLKTVANGRAADCQARYGSKWEHWIRTDDSGARLPTPEDWLDLKEFLGLDDRYDRDLLPYTGKQLIYRAMAQEFGNNSRRASTVIREEWENNPGVATLGWRPGCTCFDHHFAPPADLDQTVLHPVCAGCGETHTRPARVLDVTVGSGTTVQVARLLGRQGIGLDISGDYLREQARFRVMRPAKIYRKPEVPALTWTQPLPDNQVIHGNVATVLPRLPRGVVDLLFWDPPFNIGKSYGGGIDDALPETYYWELLRFWLDLCTPLLKPTGSIVIYHIPQWAFHIASYLEGKGLHFRGWVTRKADQHNYANRPQLAPEHYPFLWFSRSDEFTFNRVRVPHKRCARCGDYSTHWGGKEKFRDEDGKFAPDVWDDLPNPRNRAKVRLANELPVEAVLRWVLSLTNPGDYVLDPMIGSGTTAAACELSGRHWGGVEIVEDNLPHIRLKQLTARGVGQVVDVPGLGAEKRVALAEGLSRLWGDLERTGEDETLIAAGRDLAEKFMAGSLENEIVDELQE